MNYEEMSDKEINIAVASAVGESPFVSKCINFGGSESSVAVGFGNCMRTVDYCNRWEDAGPVIFDNGICLASPVKPRDEWIITWTIDGGLWSVNDITYRHKNPLRAAMIVYLKMENAEK